MEFVRKLTQQFSALDYAAAAAGLLLLVLSSVVLCRAKGRDESGEMGRQKKKEQEEKRYLNMYRIFTEHPLFYRIFRRYVLRLSRRLAVLSVYTTAEIQAGAAKYAYRLFCGICCCAAVSCLVFSDITSVILCVAFFFVYLQTSVERAVEATTYKVYRELKMAVASVRIEYKKGNSDVLLALENAAYQNRIAPLMERLRAVLTSAVPQEALSEFYEMVPFKQIQTLAMICYNIKNSGDSTDKYNNSTFDEAMLLMNSDINQKIQQMDYERVKFRRLENMALLGIVCTVALRYLMFYIMPAAALIYNSFVGFLIQNGIIFLSIYYYYIIAHAHLQSVMVNDDRSDAVQALMKKRFVRRIVRGFVPEKQKYRQVKRRLELGFSKKTVEDFWCEKCLWAFVSFCAVAVLVFSSPVIERKFLYRYTRSFDMMGDNSAYEDRNGKPVITEEEIRSMDDTYIAVRKAGKWADREDEDTLAEIHALVRSYLPDIGAMQMQDMIKRMETKYSRLQNVGFHWYLLLFAYGAAAIAFRMPDLALGKRREIAGEEEEEEFLQLQIVTMILASMDLDAMEAVGHLALIADIHKDLLTRCDYGFASDPAAELALVQEKTQSENFRLFIGKLKETVEDLSLKEVFADLASDRAHICAERDVCIRDRIDRRRARMGLLALRPMNFAIYGMAVFPLLYTGLTGLMASMSQITRL